MKLGSRESKKGIGKHCWRGKTVIMDDRVGNKKRRETTTGNKKKSKKGRDKE